MIRSQKMAIFQSRRKDILVKGTSGIQILTDGKVYFDAISGIFNMPFGYSCAPIIDRVKESFDNYPFHPKDHFYTDKYLEVAKDLLGASGYVTGGILFLNSGSEGVEAAISMALQKHRLSGEKRKCRIIARAHSYHGATLGARSVTGRNNFGDLIAEGFETIRIPPPFKDYQGDQGVTFDVDEIESLILRENPSSIAAFIFEPVNHLKGMQQSSAAYMRGIRSLCDKYNIIMIADEIISGMYRTGSFLYAHIHDVLPDIVVIGKGISSGYAPVSAVIASAAVTDSFAGDSHWRSFSHSHTYAANPVGLTAVQATYQHFHTERVNEHFDGLATRFRRQIDELRQVAGVVRADAVGLLAGINLDHSIGEATGKAIEDLCFDRGVIVRGEENWMTLAPSYNTEFEQLDHICSVVGEAINEVVSNASGTL
ncbi:aminotransferase class III-fold pyridoxal phosphate-dependent enzyme [Oligoflexia bacterium]|nr:aminotransferase class III-fold pyridoxal phosphate-dependent enzyme [Oligoflexia bacterium]